MLAKILDEVIYPLVDLTSLFADCPASIERIHLHRPGEPPAAGRFSETAFELIVSPSRRPSELCTNPIRLATFDADFPFGDVCSNWMQVWADADVRILLDRFFTQAARPSPFPEVTFLGLAVFLEGFHKATVQRGERPYLSRLEELLSVVNELLRATETDGVVLAETIRDTRNTLAHGRRTEGDRTVDGFALQSLNGVADSIVRGLILTQLDFTSDEVADLLRLKCAKIHGQNVGMPWHSST